MMRIHKTVLLTVLMFTAIGAARAQTVVLRDAPEVAFPSGTDSNSPAHWDGNTLYIINSGGTPHRSKGPDQFHLSDATPMEYNNDINGKRWIECTWKADDGTLYGWYHNEPHGLCPGTSLTAPRIGAARSKDNGVHWEDLGLILEARPGTLDCTYQNGFFAGGNGDFSCMLDSKGRYMYFFISTYAGKTEEQGVAIARMLWNDRDQPAGKVYKYHNGKWDEPGVGGYVTPIFPAFTSWKEPNSNAFWGPSIHWNTHLKTYVILMNRTQGQPNWKMEGVYVTYNKDLSNPPGWSKPEKIVEGGNWYPQVIGVNSKARETDKLCGKQARFYMHGHSKHEIIFLKDGEDKSKLPPAFK